MYEPNEYAVRWAQEPRKNLDADQGCTWTKWHWTTDSDFTICGWPIVLGRDDVPMFPQTDDIERVDCGNCLRILSAQQVNAGELAICPICGLLDKDHIVCDNGDLECPRQSPDF